METLHAEGGQSPFVARDESGHSGTVDHHDDLQYTDCPIRDCGEMVLASELDSHIEMHGEEDGENDAETAAIHSSSENARGENSREVRSSPNESASQVSAKAAWKAILKMPDISSKSHSKPPSQLPQQLGKAELGPYAHEKQMPSWLVRLLQADGEIKTINRLDSDGKYRKVKYCVNQAPDIIPILTQLLAQDPMVDYAYICDPAVLHVSKLSREGHEAFQNRLPTIFDIQDYIEKAWDLGINAQGRIETGGIRGTRKYIGTPDAHAMFRSLGITCEANAIKTRKKAQTSAHQLLYKAVEQYFVDGCTIFDQKVRKTSLPSIYFQHPGHSMTIIGFEQLIDGTKNLLVFDPVFHDSSKVTKLVGQTFIHKSPGNVLKAYRRGTRYLKKYHEFELLKYVPFPVIFLALPDQPTDM
ncbi:peptidase family C78 protein [Rutstroemia sp. NJR-2017a WRK4]|nr:peptidase family C78 protein [Rutstroemia sp. NJR-2017a WRK4]